jgi:hypothetical protein
LKKYKLPGSDEIPAELIQALAEILVTGIHNSINSIDPVNRRILVGTLLHASVHDFTTFAEYTGTDCK